METNYLRSFLLVVESGSMSEAARRLARTPAAVAQQMRALERELHASLLARSGRTVQPTEAGHKLVGRARALLREWGDIQAWVCKEQPRGGLAGAGQKPEPAAAVCLSPPFTLTKTFGWALLRQEPLVLLAPHRLAGRDPHELLRT